MRWWLGGPGAESLLLFGMTGAISRSGPRSTAVKPLCPLSAPALSDRGTGGTDPPSNSGFVDVIRAICREMKQFPFCICLPRVKNFSLI